MCEQLAIFGIRTIVVECYLEAAIYKLNLRREGTNLLSVPLRQVGFEPIALIIAAADPLAPLYKTQEHNID